MTRLRLDRKPNRSRVQSLAAGSVQVKPSSEPGKFGAGMLSDVSAITRGEALGHGYWCDQFFIEQVATAMAAATNGIKSRFTHPGLSADGLAKGLGLGFGGKVAGEQVLFDLHFYESARKSPDGDLAGYVMQRAAEDPFHFGMSIVFVSDDQAEKDFMLANGGVIVVHDDGWETYETIEGFKSPDPLNVDNLPHCRLSEFLAVDVVDDPAANPNGLFHRDLSTIDAAQSYLDYALGLSEQKPTGMAFDIDPDRARLFIQRYAAQRGLKGVEEMPKLLKKGRFTAPQNDPNAPPPKPGDQNPPNEQATEPGAVTCPDCGAVFVPDAAEEPKPITENPTDYAANHGKYTAAFGAENGTKWFLSGVKFSDAQKLHFDAQLAAKDAEIVRLNEQLTKANEKLAAIANSGETPLDASPPPKGTEGQQKKTDFASLIKPAVKAS